MLLTSIFFFSDEDSDIVNKNSDTEDANKENGVGRVVSIINTITFILKVQTYLFKKHINCIGGVMVGMSPGVWQNVNLNPG